MRGTEGPSCRHNILLCACCHHHLYGGGGLAAPSSQGTRVLSQDDAKGSDVWGGLGSGTSGRKQVAFRCCVTSVTAGPFPGHAPAPSPTAWLQPALSPSWQRQRGRQRSRQVGAGLCWHSHSLSCARARQERCPSPGSCCDHMQQRCGSSGHGMSPLGAGSHLALPRCPHPITLPLLRGSSQHLGNSAQQPSPSLGLPPNCCLEKPQMSQLQEEVKEEARAAHSPGQWESWEQGVRVVSQQTPVRKVSTKLLVAVGVTGGTGWSKQRKKQLQATARSGDRRKARKLRIWRPSICPQRVNTFLCFPACLRARLVQPHVCWCQQQLK